MNFKYCPLCATELEKRQLHGRERQQCPACHWIHFKDPKVGAGVLAEQNGKVLLVRRGVNPGKGLWCFPSGFMEIDETSEEAAIRECKEETGFDIEITALLNVFHFHADFKGAGILILYRGIITGGAATPMDDVTEVGFFALDEIPFAEIAFQSNRVALEKWAGEQVSG